MLLFLKIHSIKGTGWIGMNQYLLDSHDIDVFHDFSRLLTRAANIGRSKTVIKS